MGVDTGVGSGLFEGGNYSFSARSRENIRQLPDARHGVATCSYRDCGRRKKPSVLPNRAQGACSAHVVRRNVFLFFVCFLFRRNVIQDCHQLCLRLQGGATLFLQICSGKVTLCFRQQTLCRILSNLY